MRSSFTVLVICAIGAEIAAQQSFHTTPPPIPRFSCSGRPMGYYADVETNCRAYHTCDDHGNHFAHYCPEDTAFRQDAMICDHAYLVDCLASIEIASKRAKLEQDQNHEAVGANFDEPRGEGTNNRGFARSFRIKPDTQSSQGNNKYPTFVLNSSVFLKDRNNSPKSTSSPNSFDSKDSHRETFKTSETSNGFKTNSASLFFRPLETSSTNVASTTTVLTISEELQPPTESPIASKVINYEDEQLDDEYSFLIPPPERDDNSFFQKHDFESLKTEDTSFPKFSANDFKQAFNNGDNFKNQDSNTQSFAASDFKQNFNGDSFKNDNSNFQKFSVNNDFKPSFNNGDNFKNQDSNSQKITTKELKQSFNNGDSFKSQDSHSQNFATKDFKQQPFTGNTFENQDANSRNFAANGFKQQPFTVDTFKKQDSNFPKFTTTDFQQPFAADSFQEDSFESDSFDQRTKMIFDMMKAKSLSDDAKSSFSVTKPSKLLEPPLFKSTDFPHARSTFNFHTDDYPYVETLRSIQNSNNKPSFGNLMTRSTFSDAASHEESTEASIFPVPTKALMSGTSAETDPYYPKTQSTTEAFFTPRQRPDKIKKHTYTTTRRPNSQAKFEIPAVLPDLNSLEDLLDRRKYFFIPKLKSSQ